jgi:hypothetical protein
LTNGPNRNKKSIKNIIEGISGLVSGRLREEKKAQRS